MDTGPDSGMDDRELIEAVLRDGEEASFRRLYRRHSDRLYSLVGRLLAGHGDVDEVFQESWVRIIERLSTFSGRSTFAAWTSGVALNCAREWRRERGRQGDALGDPIDAHPLRSPDIAIDLERAIARLPDGYREVLILHDIHGHTHGEIAELLGVSVGTSKSQLSRARRAAREYLSKEKRS